MTRHLVVIALALTMGCSSFSEASDPDGGDAGVAGDAGGLESGSSADGGVDASARFCPTPTVTNTKCWDFDDGKKPGGETQAGELLADPSVFTSPGHSMRASTPALAQGANSAWAYVVDTRAPAPKGATLELRLYIDEGFDRGDVLELGFGEQAGTQHEMLLLAQGGGQLELQERTIVANNVEDSTSYPLGSIGEKTWARVSIAVDYTAFPGNSASRHLVVVIDGAGKVDEQGSSKLALVTMSNRSIVKVGLSYVSPFSSAKRAQSVHVDDVLVTWR